MFLKTILKRFLIIFALLFCLFVFSILIKDYKYPTNKDTHAVYGDGRFQIGIFGSPVHYALFDAKLNTALVYDVEKFYKKNEKIYITGYFISSKLEMYSINKLNSWTGIKPQTGQKTEYTNLEDIPRYSILNYETGNVILYKTLEEIPEKDRKIFEKEKFNFYILCYLRGTCFDKNRD